MARRCVERRVPGRFDLHAVVRAVVDTALAIFGDGRQRAIGTAIHLVVAHERQLIQIDIGAALHVVLYRRVFFVDDDRRDRIGFSFQTRFGHLAARQRARHTEGDLGFSLGDFAVEHKRKVAHCAVEIERLIENRDGKFFLRAEMLDDRRGIIMRRVDGLADMNHFVRNLAAAFFEKRAQALRHGIPEALKNYVFTTKARRARSFGKFELPNFVVLRVLRGERSYFYWVAALPR